jgi:hypothetical protein
MADKEATDPKIKAAPGGDLSKGEPQKLDETVPGGHYIVDGRHLDANGNELNEDGNELNEDGTAKKDSK